MSLAASVLTKGAMTDVLKGEAAPCQADEACNLAPVCRAARRGDMRDVRPQHWGWRQDRETSAEVTGGSMWQHLTAALLAALHTLQLLLPAGRTW